MSISSAEREIPSADARCIGARAASAPSTADPRPSVADSAATCPWGTRSGHAVGAASVTPLG